METRVVFPKRTDGKLCICPFAGYRFSSIEEFKGIIKQFFSKEKGYPGLYFETKNPDVRIIFSGHQYEHGPEGRWSLFYTKIDENVCRWQPLTEELLEMFDRADYIDSQIKMLGEIINANGGIEININH